MTEPTRLSSPDTATVYGRDTCEDTTRALRHFEAAGLPHRYLNLDHDAGAKARVTGVGHHATPVVVTPSGEVFVEPSDTELDGIVASTPAASVPPPSPATPAADAR